MLKMSIVIPALLLVLGILFSVALLALLVFEQSYINDRMGSFNMRVERLERNQDDLSNRVDLIILKAMNERKMENDSGDP